MKRLTIIVAAGSGQRFGNVLPKQFAILTGKPVLMHAIEKFIFLNGEIIVVLAEDYIKYWENLCVQYSFDTNHLIVTGGNSRTESVKNGLALIKEEGIVAIHDGARPLVSEKLIENVFSFAEKNGNAVPAISLNESLRIINEEGNKSTKREQFKQIQTPQCYNVSRLKAAYDKFTGQSFSDDASVIEAAGEKIFLIDGERSNIKITEAVDLVIAEALSRINLTSRF